MADIRPFKIEIPDKELDLLKQKLSLTRLPGELDDADWDYGAPLKDIKRLSEYWETSYDWRKHEAKLNELNHFKTKITIDGFPEIDLHFVHTKSKVKGAIPLLFVHGWPGSFLEATKLIPLLTNPKDGEPAFDVVAPSLPNFGFSSRVPKRSFGIGEHATVLNKLMLKLGYNSYVTQGGDWGFLITRALGHLFPENVKAIHTNMVNAPWPSFLTAPIHATTTYLKFLGQAPYLRSIVPSFLTYSKQEMQNLMRAKSWFEGEGRGYFALMGTKPQTIAYSLADSPVGLLSFIYEKLVAWTDDYPWTDDEVLTWLSIYWFSTAGPGASGFIYKEATLEGSPGGRLPRSKLTSPVKMPLGLAYFPTDILNMPKSWTSGLGNVVFISEHDKGGHFAAFENPQGLASDLKKMFGKQGGAFGVVKGLEGY